MYSPYESKTLSLGDVSARTYRITWRRSAHWSERGGISPSTARSGGTQIPERRSAVSAAQASRVGDRVNEAAAPPGAPGGVPTGGAARAATRLITSAPYKAARG